MQITEIFSSFTSVLLTDKIENEMRLLTGELQCKINTEGVVVEQKANK